MISRPASAAPWPTEIRLHSHRRILTMTFDNGERYDLPAEYLRVMSPSAEVQGHAPDQQKTVSGKRTVAILRLDPVGNYAVRILFDDMHNTGIYGWDYLLVLGRELERRWSNYLIALQSEGLSRDLT